MKRFFKSLSKMAVLFLLLAGMCAGVFAPFAEAVPAMPGVHTHIQKDGTVVHYQLHGDEFLLYMTDSNGDLVAFGQDGDIYLARWAREDESDSSDTVPTNSKPSGGASGIRAATLENMQPLKVSIPQHLLERAGQARDERDRRWREQFITSPDAKTAPMSVRLASESNIEHNVLMIYVSFADDGGVPSMQGLAIPDPQTLHSMMFDDNFGTVAHYYKTVTDGAARIKPAATINTLNPGIIFVKLPGSHGDWGVGSDEFVIELLLPALRQAANPSNPGGYINYSMFDVDGDGKIQTDELSIGLIVHGYEEAVGGPAPAFPSIWGHASTLNPSGNLPPTIINGVSLRQYFAQGAYQTRSQDPSQNPPQLLTMGIIAHELGHDAFGFIDLYDTGGVGTALSYWSLMAGGSWGGDPGGSSPTVLDAFHLFGGGDWMRNPTIDSTVQFIAPQPVTLGVNNLTSLTKYAKLETSDPNQYFLIQPRGNVGYDHGSGYWDSHFNPKNISSGLLFLLIDKNLGGHNNSFFSHFHVSVVPAGLTQLTGPYNSLNNTNDLFSNTTQSYINNTSTPPSKIYAGTSSAYPTVDSGWSVESITASATGVGTNNGTVGGSFFVRNAPVIITITAQPAEYTAVTQGSITGSLSVAASVLPSGTPTYQWYSNTTANNSGGTLISGATDASFTIPTTLTEGTYYYFCEVGATGADTVRSNVATVTVTMPFIAVTNITGVPTMATAGTPRNMTGTVVPSDATNKTITWSVKNAGTTGATISGSTLNTTAAGIAVVTATVANGTAVGTPYARDFNITVNTADIDQNNNITIGDTAFNLDTDANGTGWNWNATDKILTLTGVNMAAIDITTEHNVKIVATDSLSTTGISNAGGGLTITSGTGGALTINSTNGSAISAEGDIVIEGSTLYASTQDTSAVIHSISGSVRITGNANITLVAAGGLNMAAMSPEDLNVTIMSTGRSAITAAKDIEISTSGNVNATAAGSGYALEAGMANNTITIRNGTTRLFAADNYRTFNISPNISGNRTLVYVNGELFWGNEGSGGGGGGGNRGGEEEGGGGCNAAPGLLIVLSALPLLLIKRKR